MKNIKKIHLSIAVASVLLTQQPLYAGDIEVILPGTTDAFTIDQPTDTELMRVNGDGNVGIGTTEPGGQLHVTANNTIIPFITDSEDGSASWWVHNSYRSSQYGPTLAFRKHHGTKATPEAITTNSRIQEIHAQGFDGTALAEASSIVTVPTENWTTTNHGSRMDIYAGSPATGGKISLLSTGSVGVGTLTPSDASGLGGQALKLDVEGAVGATSYCDENGENCQTILQLATGGKFIDGTDPNNAVYTAGNVGIGTTTPDFALDVLNTSGTHLMELTGQNGVAVQVLSTGTTLLNGGSILGGPAGGTEFAEMSSYYPQIYMSNSNSGSYPFNAYGNLILQSRLSKPRSILFVTSFTDNTPTAKMVIGSSGNVGIGTTSPSDASGSGGQALKLDVEGAVGATSYCDENGENCQTILQLAGGGSGKFVDGTNPDDAVYTTGKVGIGTTDPIGNLHIVDSDTAYQTQFLIENKNASVPNTYEYKGGYAWQRTAYDNWNGEPRFMMARSRGTIDAPTANQNGDFMGQIEFRAYDGGTHRRGASIRAEVDGTVAASNMPGSLHFLTEEEGGSDLVERMVISNNGNVGIGSTNPTTATLVLDRTTENAIKFEDNGTLRGMLGISANAGQGILDSDAEDFNIRSEGSNLRFSTNAGNNTAVIIDPTGKVGIGTTTPSEILEIHGNTDADLDMYSYGSDNTTFHIGRAGGTKAAPTIVSQTNTLFALEGMGYDGTGYKKAGAIMFTSDGEPGVNDMPGSLSFHTTADGASNYTQRMIIKNNGNIGIGIPNPTNPLQIASGAHVTSAGVWVNASDISKKENIQEINYGLDTVMKLKPAEYDYKNDSSHSIGFIAQEIEKVIPEVVNGEDGNKGVAYGSLTAVLVKAMQQQQAQIEAQQKRIEALEAKLK